jgi:hypothetical protein
MALNYPSSLDVCELLCCGISVLWRERGGVGLMMGKWGRLLGNAEGVRGNDCFIY